MLRELAAVSTSAATYVHWRRGHWLQYDWALICDTYSSWLLKEQSTSQKKARKVANSPSILYGPNTLTRLPARTCPKVVYELELAWTRRELAWTKYPIWNYLSQTFVLCFCHQCHHSFFLQRSSSHIKKHQAKKKSFPTADRAFLKWLPRFWEQDKIKLKTYPKTSQAARDHIAPTPFFF